MFTGKGGVGKTTSVVACALAAADAGRRPLVIELGHRASLEAVFGEVGGGQDLRIGYAPRAVGRGVHAMNLEFEASLVEYLEQNIKIKRLVRAITRNNALMRFFQAAPSVSEVATLNKLAALVGETDAGGKPRWDPVIVDLDATGHALMLLNLPRVMDGLIGDGPMRGLIDGFSGLLSDPKRSCLNLVTLPRELPAQETLELFETLERDHKVPLGKLIVNKVPVEPLSEGVDESALAELRVRLQGGDFPATERALVVADRARARCVRARSELEKLRSGVHLPLVELPAHDAIDLDALTVMGQEILAKGGASA